MHRDTKSNSYALSVWKMFLIKVFVILEYCSKHSLIFFILIYKSIFSIKNDWSRVNGLYVGSHEVHKYTNKYNGYCWENILSLFSVLINTLQKNRKNLCLFIYFFFLLCCDCCCLLSILYNIEKCFWICVMWIILYSCYTFCAIYLVPIKHLYIYSLLYVTKKTSPNNFPIFFVFLSLH